MIYEVNKLPGKDNYLLSSLEVKGSFEVEVRTHLYQGTKQDCKDMYEKNFERPYSKITITSL